MSTFDDLFAGIVEDQSVAVAEDVVADPAHHLEVARWANIGARTVFIRVSPVLPSLPAWSAPVDSASSCRAGSEAPRLGVKLM